MFVKSAFLQPIKHVNQVSSPHSNSTEESRFDQFLGVHEKRAVFKRQETEFKYVLEWPLLYSIT